MIGTDAFQEADITGITIPITKQNYFVRNGSDLPRVLQEAFHLARTGRPGPGPRRRAEGRPAHRDRVERLSRPRRPARLPADARAEHAPGARGRPADRARPAARHHRRPGRAALRRLGRAAALRRKDAHPGHHHAARHLRLPREPPAVARASSACTAGCTATTPSTTRTWSSPSACAWTTARGQVRRLRAEGARSSTSTSTPPRSARTCASTCRSSATWRACSPSSTPEIQPTRCRTTSRGSTQIGDWREQYPPKRYPRDTPELYQPQVIQAIQRATRGEAIDRGRRRPAPDVRRAALPVRRAVHATSPRAAWARWATRCQRRSARRWRGRTEQVWCVVGDGCFQMTLQELAVMAAHRVPVKIALLNNELPGHGPPAAAGPVPGNLVEVDLAGAPDYVKLAQAYGIPAWRVTDPARSKTRSARRWPTRARPSSSSASRATRTSTRGCSAAPRSARCCPIRRYEAARERALAGAGAESEGWERPMSKHTLVATVEEGPGRPQSGAQPVPPALVRHRVPVDRTHQRAGHHAADHGRRRRAKRRRAGHQAALQGRRGAQSQRPQR